MTVSWTSPPARSFPFPSLFLSLPHDTAMRPLTSVSSEPRDDEKEPVETSGDEGLDHGQEEGVD